jgi:hypothetical protein
VTLPHMKVDISASLNVRVPIETKQRAMRLRDITNESLPRLTERAWQLLENDILSGIATAERERYLTRA